MKNEEKQETSLEFFYRNIKNDNNNLDNLNKYYEFAIKEYEEEIKKAKKKGWTEGAQNFIFFYKNIKK
jgi:hypothetical protein